MNVKRCSKKEKDLASAKWALHDFCFLLSQVKNGFILRKKKQYTMENISDGAFVFLSEDRPKKCKGSFVTIVMRIIITLQFALKFYEAYHAHFLHRAHGALERS